MKKIGIIGSGSWGTALGVLLGENALDVRLWGRETAVVDAINVVEASIQQRWPQAKWCFFEPDVVAGKD